MTFPALYQGVDTIQGPPSPDGSFLSIQTLCKRQDAAAYYTTQIFNNTTTQRVAVRRATATNPTREGFTLSLTNIGSQFTVNGTIQVYCYDTFDDPNDPTS